jgi:hypothetical protein
VSYEVHHERRPEYTGELSLGAAPDGVLEFTDGVATVEAEARAEAIADRYAAITYDGSTADSGTSEDTVDSDDAFDPAAFVDRTPMDDVIADIESGDYDAHLDAIEAAEAEGRDRDGVADAIDERRE